MHFFSLSKKKKKHRGIEFLARERDHTCMTCASFHELAPVPPTIMRSLNP
jgi:hypothetical protein